MIFEIIFVNNGMWRGMPDFPKRKSGFLRGRIRGVGSTGLLLICELFETISETETWHILHENPLGSHRGV